jgi:hypothetical protein
MKEFRAADLFGPICVAPEDGAKLCNLVREALDQGEEVCLDFSGVTTLASQFLNTAVGCLYAFFRQEDLDRRLLWKGLDPTDEAIVRLVRRNAIRFYEASSSQQEALIAAAARAVTE